MPSIKVERLEYEVEFREEKTAKENVKGMVENDENTEKVESVRQRRVD